RVGIVLGDCPKLPLREIGYRLRKDAEPVEIGVVAVIAVARPKTGIDRELQKIGQPLLFLVGPGRMTAAQSAERLEVDRLSALRNQVSVEEGEVADLVIGIVVDIDRHV